MLSTTQSLLVRGSTYNAVVKLYNDANNSRKDTQISNVILREAIAKLRAQISNTKVIRDAKTGRFKKLS